MPIKAISILALLLVIVWIPVIFSIYNVITAVILTFGTGLSGIIGERFLNKSNGKSP